MRLLVPVLIPRACCLTPQHTVRNIRVCRFGRKARQRHSTHKIPHTRRAVARRAATAPSAARSTATSPTALPRAPTFFSGVLPGSDVSRPHPHRLISPLRLRWSLRAEPPRLRFIGRHTLSTPISHTRYYALPPTPDTACAEAPDATRFPRLDRSLFLSSAFIAYYTYAHKTPTSHRYLPAPFILRT